MKHKIDPKVDCVFKAVLGSEKHRNLLIHFLNAVLEPEPSQRIVDARILNPYNESCFQDDKLTVVDVKAKDQCGRLFQIEIQLLLHANLKARILYNWCSLYYGQLKKGDGFQKLNPAVSIWILNENLFTEVDAYHFPFSIVSPMHGIELNDHFNVHVLQLPAFQLKDAVHLEKERWLYFFKEGENINPRHPPEWLATKEMREAMEVLIDFSENERNYHLYQSRLEAQIVENTWKEMLEKERQEKEKERRAKEKERQAKEKERQAKEKERQEKKRLLQLLKKAGIDPGSG